ncbi:MAG: hypothetical protein U0231_00740 [Nitrospiraceae bacterium]
MVWNHSAVGGMVRYRVCPGISLAVCVGDYDLHTFEGLMELARALPDQARRLCEELLGQGKGTAPAPAMGTT